MKGLAKEHANLSQTRKGQSYYQGSLAYFLLGSMVCIANFLERIFERSRFGLSTT